MLIRDTDEERSLATVFTDLGIAVLAEVIKWSSPWYVRNLFIRPLKRVWPYLMFLVTVVLFVLIPPSEEHATYRIPTLEEFWASLVPNPLDILPEEPPAPPPPPAPTPPPESSFSFSKDFARHFPMPEELQYQVALWKDIFSRYHSRQIIIHDSLHFQLVYEIIDLDKQPASVSATISKYRRILRALASKEKKKQLHKLTADEKRVYNLFETVEERDKFNRAACREMRGQSGQRDRFLEALRRSGLYQEHFLRTFQDRGLPLELTWLPFVESYYNYQAYSRAGAAGVWQFIPSTARLYGLHISKAVDERYDPFKSAVSAAELLKANYEMFQTWPLAITVYNHGNLGMLRAVRELGTSDFGKIATKYRSPSFGFYSRNYYAQFLAVAQIMREAEKHFGDIELFPPIEYEEIRLESGIYLNDITTKLSISRELLASLNRDLRHSALQSKTPLPKNFTLKLPVGKKEQFLLRGDKKS